MARQAAKVFSFLKNESVLDIRMYGVLYGDWTNGSDEAALVDAIRNCLPTDSICLHINSEGGSMFSGIAIKNLLDSHPGEVTCIVEGIAASAASIAAMAGKTVMRPGSMMMVHNPWAVVAGDADDMRTAADMLDKSRDSLVSIYQEKTGKSITELKALLKAETWLTADEAVEEGFADETGDDDGDEDDYLDVVALSKRRVRINDVAFPTNRVPPQILAMARPIETQSQENPMKSVLAALSLKDNANEGEALVAINKIADDRKHILALTGKDNIAEALGVLAAWKSAADEVGVLKAQAEQRAAEQAAKDFDAEIANAKKSGLLASSDEHKRNKAALAYKGKSDALASLKGFLGALDPLVPVAGPAAAPTEPPVNAPQVVALTDEEKRIAAKLNVSHEALIKNKQRLALKAAQAPSKRVSDDEEDAA